MKYALLVLETPELTEHRKDSAFQAAGRAYGEALQAAGIFVGGTGLESSQTATTVSVRDGKRHIHDGPYAETKEFLAGFAIIRTCSATSAGGSSETTMTTATCKVPLIHPTGTLSPRRGEGWGEGCVWRQPPACPEIITQS